MCPQASVTVLGGVVLVQSANVPASIGNGPGGWGGSEWAQCLYNLNLDLHFDVDQIINQIINQLHHCVSMLLFSIPQLGVGSVRQKLTYTCVSVPMCTLYNNIY